MLTNPRRGWQLDSMARPVHGPITTLINTFERWLQGELSNQRLELTPKMLANPRRGWQLESTVKPVEDLITTFMATCMHW